MKRIVVVGAGFAGLAATRQLVKDMKGQADIVLIDNKPAFVFLPWLIDALGEDRSLESIQGDLRMMSRKEGFRFFMGEVSHIDREQQRVFMTDPANQNLFPVEYDQLILCPGSKTNYFGVQGAEEFAFGLKYTNDVMNIHRRAQETVKMAMAAQTEEELRAILSYTVVGAGPSGIEALAALQKYVLNQLQQVAPELIPFASFTIIQAGPQILPGFHAATVNGALKALAALDIQVMVGDPVTKVTDRFLLTKSGKRIDTRLTLWCAGIEPIQIQMMPDVHREPNGGLLTEPSLRFTNTIFAAGDVVNFKQNNVLIPKNAQTAMRMGKTLAQNAMCAMNGQPLKAFWYLSKGSIITVGKQGFLELPFVTIPSTLVTKVRGFLYKLRFKELTGMDAE